MPPSPRERVYSATPSEVLKFVWDATKQHTWFFALMLTVVVLATISSILVPLKMGRFVDVLTNNTPSRDVLQILSRTILFIVLYKLLFGLFFRISGYTSARMVPRIMAELEEKALKGVLSHSHAFFTDRKSVV